MVPWEQCYKYFHFMSLVCQVYLPCSWLYGLDEWFLLSTDCRPEYNMALDSWRLIRRRPPDFWLLNDHSKIAKIYHCRAWHDDRIAQQYLALTFSRFNSSYEIWALSRGNCYFTDQNYKWSFKLVDECFFCSGSNLVENLSVTEISSCPGLVSHWPPTRTGWGETVWKSTQKKSLKNTSVLKNVLA